MGQEMLEDPEEGKEKGKEPPPLDAQDIAILKHYGKGLYFDAVKRLETDCKDLVKQVRAGSSMLPPPQPPPPARPPARPPPPPPPGARTQHGRSRPAPAAPHPASSSAFPAS